jgi:hypothetical protein
MNKTCRAVISRNVNNSRPGQRCGKRAHADGLCYAHHPSTRSARAADARNRALKRADAKARVVVARRLVLDAADTLAAMLFVDGIVRDRTMANMSPDVQECVWKVAEAAFSLQEAQR